MTPCTIILDTNIYLHYTFFTEVPWPDIVQADEVLIIVPPIILSEIDKHKYSHASSKIKERASKVAKRFAELLDHDEEICPGVRIIFHAVEPTDFATHQLVRESQDDLLLASILGYTKENPQSEIVLVTSDISLKVKSRVRNIRTLSLPDDYLLASEDPNEKKVKELEKKLRELQHLAPALKLQFGGDTDRFEYPKPSETVDKEALVQTGMRDIKNRYPRMGFPHADFQSQGLRNAFDYLIEETLFTADIRDYNQSLDEFFEKYEKYLVECVKIKEIRRRTIELQIKVHNGGTSPAQDVRVFIKLPVHLRVTIAKERFSLPRKPVVPDKPKPRSSFLLSPYPRTPFVVPNLTGFTQPPAITWLGFKTNKLFHVLSFEVRKLNHGYSEECPKSPYIVFDSFDAMSSFKIEYEITAANIPGKSEGFLHVIVKD